MKAKMIERKVFMDGYVETYASLMSSVANVSINNRYRIKASVCIGAAVVKNTETWGIIKGDQQRRNYIIALTANGGILHDPITGQTSSLVSIPNREHIMHVLLSCKTR